MIPVVSHAAVVATYMSAAGGTPSTALLLEDGTGLLLEDGTYLLTET